MPRNMFIIELKKTDDEAVPTPQERASVPGTPVSPSRTMVPPSSRPRPGGGERRDQHKQHVPGADARRRRSGASRFRG